jgi:hypothetical protein
VNHDDLRAYAGRDWRVVEDAKRRYWIERKKVLTPTAALAIAEGLRLHVRALRPDWPSETERTADLATHAKVSTSLRSVS